MGVIRGLLTGFTLSGLVTLAYQQQIYSTSSTLRNALSSLSRDLDSLRVYTGPDHTLPTAPVTLAELPLGEQVKAQWNEQLLRGVSALHTTDWSTVAQRGWRAARAEAHALRSKLSSW